MRRDAVCHTPPAIKSPAGYSWRWQALCKDFGVRASFFLLLPIQRAHHHQWLWTGCMAQLQRQAPPGLSGPVLLPSQHPPLPVASAQTTEILRSTVRSTAIRLVSLDGFSYPSPTSARSSWAEPHQRQSPLKVGYSWKSLFGLQQSGQLKVVLQASGHEPSLVTFGSIAGGVISVDELWQLAKAPARPCYSPQRTKPRSHSLVDKLARAFSRQSIVESEPMYGNVWVYVADQNGRRYGSVLVSAWLGTKMETITTTTLDPSRALMVMISHDFTSVVSEPQEQMPVTCWEAYDSCLAAAIRDQKKGRSDLHITSGGGC
ncbi:hypothetical protein WJX77_008801 [Trebouxia sp. C0004]